MEQISSQRGVCGVGKVEALGVQSLWRSEITCYLTVLVFLWKTLPLSSACIALTSYS